MSFLNFYQKMRKQD